MFVFSAKIQTSDLGSFHQLHFCPSVCYYFYFAAALETKLFYE